jgi:hypothetical protein
MLATFFLTMACTLVLAAVLVVIRYRIETLADGAVTEMAAVVTPVSSREAEPVQ